MNKEVTSIFGAFAGKIQAIVDKRKDKFKQRLYGQYLDWSLPQIDLSFREVIGRSRIEAIASVVGEDGVTPLVGRQALEKLDGTIPLISQAMRMSSSDYRAYLTMQNLSNIDDDTKKKQIIDLIFNDAKRVTDACTGRLDVMFLQALSTGKIDLTVANNPSGVDAGLIDLFLPNANVATASKAWTDPASTPLADLENILDVADKNGDSPAKMLMTQATFGKLKNSDEIQKIFKNEKEGYALVTLPRVNDYLSSNGMPTIEIIKAKFSLEKDGKLESVTPFAEDVIVFIPEGKLGTIKNGVVVEGDMVNTTGHVYANAEHVKISKWSTTEPFEEKTRGQLLAFPVLTAIDSIYHLKLK